jgi:signal transduction histidine kinase
VTTGAAEPYAAAHRLLSQLRTVARRLSAGLDARTLAEMLLHDLADVAPYDRAAVLVGGGEVLSQLAALDADGAGATVAWDVDLAADTPVSEAWLAQLPQVRDVQHAVPGEAPRPGSSLAVPLRIGARTFGVVALEGQRAGAYPAGVVAAVEDVTAEASLRLETALLFDEIRDVATNEERRRLAREIHDGIAQEIASLGYALDALSYDAARSDAELAGRIRAVRGDLTAVLREVRHSISALRTTVEEHGGLGAAVSDYARAVGTTAPFRVHLSLDEAPARLPPDTESELLRIAQEAITNARKHSRAHNLWVTCLVRPPTALVRVEDDGTGLAAAGRRDSYGLAIMRERAFRLGASLDVRQRRPSGTLVEVSIGRAPLDGPRVRGE